MPIAGHRKTLVCMLTDGCNLNCTHCFKSLISHTETPFDSFVASVEGLTDYFGKPYLVLTGGEPTIHSEFERIIDYIHEKELRFHIVTNAVRLPELLPHFRKVKDQFFFAFSLEGGNRETHDRVRGKGAFDRIMEACEVCRDEGFGFRFCITITRFNLDQIDQLMSLAEEQGVTDGIYFWPAFYAKSLYDWGLLLTDGERDYLAGRVKEFKKRGGVICGDIHRMDEKYSECDFVPMKNLTLDSDGNISLCCNLTKNRGERSRKDVIGSPLHEDFGQIIGKHMMITNDYRRRLYEDLRHDRLEGLDKYPCHWCQKYFDKFDDEVGVQSPANTAYVS